MGDLSSIKGVLGARILRLRLQGEVVPVQFLQSSVRSPYKSSFRVKETSCSRVRSASLVIGQFPMTESHEALEAEEVSSS